MNIRVNRLVYPVTTLGFGSRIGLWVQGCTIGCRGCASKDLWSNEGGRLVDVEFLADEMAQIVIEQGLDGMTITGGEPSEQVEALACLVEAVKDRLVEVERLRSDEFDVLVFSGRDEHFIKKYYPEMVQFADTVICGPYDELSPSDRWLVASENQRVCHFSELGRCRYEAGSAGNPSLQCAMVGDGMMLVGITRPNDLDELAIRLEERGIKLGGCSWHSK